MRAIRDRFGQRQTPRASLGPEEITDEGQRGQTKIEIDEK